MYCIANSTNAETLSQVLHDEYHLKDIFAGIICLQYRKIIFSISISDITSLKVLGRPTKHQGKRATKIYGGMSG